MKKLFSVILIFSFAHIALGQRFVSIPRGIAEVDGFLEYAWDVCPEQAIDLPFNKETPTLTSFFKMMYDSDNLYIIVNVVDEGNHYPGWEAEGNDDDYDNVKLYFDCNKELKDGQGPSTNFSGHYVFSGNFSKDNYDKRITDVPSAPGDRNPGGTYCYSLYGEDYIFEVAIPFANFYDKDSIQLSRDLFAERQAFGFDVVITDRDEEETTELNREVLNSGPNRAVWNSDSLDLFENMDEAGTVSMHTNGPCWYFDVSPLSLTIDTEAKINVMTDLNWSVNTDQAWLTTDPEFGKKEGEVTLRAEPNLTDKERSAVVNVVLYYVNDTISVKVTQPPYSSVLSFENETDEILIYPSVVKNYFIIKGLPGEADLNLFDITGKRVLHKRVRGQEIIPANNLTKGVYFAEIVTETGIIRKRIIKK